MFSDRQNYRIKNRSLIIRINKSVFFFLVILHLFSIVQMTRRCLRQNKLNFTKINRRCGNQFWPDFVHLFSHFLCPLFESDPILLQSERIYPNKWRPCIGVWECKPRWTALSVSVRERTNPNIELPVAMFPCLPSIQKCRVFISRTFFEN